MTSSVHHHHHHQPNGSSNNNNHAHKQPFAMSLHTSAQTAAQAINWKQSDYPHAGLLPKEETEVTTFLQQHPTRDGRGVVVAVFDTGCDPSAAALQTTTDGKPKFVDFIDATGSGDVDTSKVVKASADNTLQLLTGRTITTPPTWHGASGTTEYHLGLKAGYELFPGGLKDRVSKQRKVKFSEEVQQLQAELHGKVKKLNAKIEEAKKQQSKQNRGNSSNTATTDSSADASSTVTTDSNSSSAASSTSLEELKEQKEDLDVQITELKSMHDKYSDAGPLYDCIVYHDGDKYRAVVLPNDVPDSEIATIPALAAYKEEQQYSFLSAVDMLAYTVSIYSEGNVLSIVANAGSHGTHVAGIIAAHDPNQRELDGVAPGAQILAVKIGDSRLGSMETATGLIRGMQAAIDAGCQVINMSYGEASAKPLVGEVAKFASEVVNKHGIIYVSSAGNNGPALSTVGTLGGTESAVIGVGAYVSPSMMQAEYSMRQSVQEIATTWSSRGPATDGWAGPSITACGAAITSVPSFTLQRQQLMNGTSMSSPSAAGSVALLVSALQQANLPYTPNRIRIALENSARQIPSSDNLSRLTYGCGLIQTNKAYTYLTKYSQDKSLDIVFNVTLPALDTSRGIYLRTAEDTNKPLETAVQIELRQQPYYDINLDNSLDETVQQRHAELIALQIPIRIVNSNPEWIAAPSHVLLTNGSRGFTVVVDPSKLPPGTHFSELIGIDSSNPARGAVWRLPITICKPEEPQLTQQAQQPAGNGSELEDDVSSVTKSLNHTAVGKSNSTDLHLEHQAQYHYQYNLHCDTGSIHRRYFSVPYGATHVDVTLSSQHVDTVHSFMLHLLMLKPETPYRNHELNRLVTVQPNDTQTVSLDVTPGTVLELCLASYWNQHATTDVKVDVDFHGVALSTTGANNSINIDGNNAVSRIDVHAALRTSTLQPKLALTTLRQPVRPSSAEITPLDPVRNTLAGSRPNYQLLLTYNYEVKDESGTKLRPYIPLNGRLYDAIVQSQLAMLYDSNKRYIACWDAFSSPHQVKKGKYVLRVHVTHHDISLLEKLKDMICSFESSIPKPIELSVYSGHNDALLGNKSALVGERKVVKHGRRTALFVTSADIKSLPTHAKPGDTLRGTAHFLRPTAVYTSDKKQAGTIPLTYVVQAAASKEKKDSDDAEADAEEFNAQHTLRDQQIKLITDTKDKVQQKQLFDLLFPTLEKEYSTHPQLLALKLNVLSNTLTDKSTNIDSVHQITAAADTVIQSTDEKQLLSVYGRHTDSKDKAEKQQKKQADEHKQILLDALKVKAETIAEYIVAQLKADKSVDTDLQSQFLATYKQLQSWAGELTSKDNRTKYLPLTSMCYRLKQQYGQALKLINAELDSDSAPKRSVIDQKIELLDKLQWKRWKSHTEAWSKRLYPEAYTLF